MLCSCGAASGPDPTNGGCGGFSEEDAVSGRRTRASRRDGHRSYLQRRTEETAGAISIKEPREELADQGRPVPYSNLRGWARSRLQWPPGPARPPAPPSRSTGHRPAHPPPLHAHRGRRPAAQGGTERMCRTGHRAPTGPRLRRHARPADRRPAARLDRERRRDERARGDRFHPRPHQRPHRRTHPPLELGRHRGAVNRMKKTKRQLYGQAEFEPLRKMILLQ